MNSMTKSILTMQLMKETYGVCRLDSGESIPEWASRGKFFSITRTEDELSVVCDEQAIPERVKCEKDWRVLKVLGPLDFSLIGILSSISSILAEEKISIFAISTYDTDYILVKEKDLKQGIKALEANRYKVI